MKQSLTEDSIKILDKLIRRNGFDSKDLDTLTASELENLLMLRDNGLIGLTGDVRLVLTVEGHKQLVQLNQFIA